jgi:hypothetical protein
MTSGFVIVSRDRETGGIYVETTEDWQEYMEEGDCRMIYCQAVSDLKRVQEKIDRWLEENDGWKHREGDVNDTVAEIVSSIQWIANEHPLQCFRHQVS